MNNFVIFRSLEINQFIAPELYSKKNDQEIVLFCGSPGAGKSTFYWKQLQPLGFERVNQDTLKTVSCTFMHDPVSFN